MVSQRTTLFGVILGSVMCWVFVSTNAPGPVSGMTAHGTERKTIVTVPLDVGMEAVVTLDHRTGDLTGYVLDRLSGKFFIQYQYNLTADFPGAQGNYLVAAGAADFRQITGNQRFANGVVYVAEENAGQVVAYGIPWNSRFRASDATPQRLSQRA